MKNILEQLKGGDLRSIGKSNEITILVIKNPKLFQEVFKGMTDSDPLIRMRSADIAEKVSKQHPEFLSSFKSRLIKKVAKIPQQEVRWHVAQMFSYLSLTAKERQGIAEILFSWIESEKSNIVKVMSLQTLAEFAKQDIVVKNKLVPLLKKFLKNGAPSLKSRSRRIVKELAARRYN